MKRLILILALFISGCASITDMIPSFNDANQSKAIVDVQLRIADVDCSKPQLEQVARVKSSIDWFLLYSHSKARQADVIRLVEPMSATANDWYKRAADGKDNKVFCELKQRLMTAQADKAAKAIIGRF